MTTACNQRLDLSAVQESYGDMLHHRWTEAGYVILGFKTGYMVVASSRNNEMGREVYSSRVLPSMTAMAYCPALQKVAIAGGGGAVKIITTNGYAEVGSEAISTPADSASSSMAWTSDGQVGALLIRRLRINARQSEQCCDGSQRFCLQSCLAIQLSCNTTLYLQDGKEDATEPMIASYDLHIITYVSHLWVCMFSFSFAQAADAIWLYLTTGLQAT